MQPHGVGATTRKRLKGLIMTNKTKTKKTFTSNDIKLHNVKLLNRLSLMIEKMDMLAYDVLEGQVSANEIYDRLDGIQINIRLIHDSLGGNTDV
jgi:hypothetical protein